MPIDVLIEGLLFYKSTPQKKQTVIKLLGITEEELMSALEILSERLKSGATRLIQTDQEIQLVTCSEFSPIIETLRKNELKADIGKAGSETLAIILYQGPISRAEIDRIRGVNSSFILRNLLIRGLIERIQNKNNSGYLFNISPLLLAQLGIEQKHELPNFSKIATALEKFDETNLVTEL